MLTAIAFLKLSTHLEKGKLPKGKRGRIEDMSIERVTPMNTPVQDLFPSGAPSPPRDPFQDFFDIMPEREGPQAEEPVVKTSSLALAYTGSKEVKAKVQQKLLIPRLGSSFWHTYGNRLRVFGATERLVYLGPPEEPVIAVKKTEHKGVNGEVNSEANGVRSENSENVEKKLVKETDQLICLS
jgi:poly(A)-specific ribonuclease